MVRLSLAAALVAVSLLAAAPAAEAQFPSYSIFGPPRQHIDNALRVVVGSTGYASTLVQADIPGVLYQNRPARFKAVILFDGAYANRVVIPMPPKMLRYVKKRLPKRGVLITPTITGIYGDVGVATSNPVQLLP